MVEIGDDGATDDTDGSIRDRALSFEWPGGVITGMAAYLGVYVLMGLLIVVLSVVASVEFPGSPTTRLTRLGFVLYNAHGIVIAGEAPPTVIAPDFNLLRNATQPLVYRAVPVVGLLGASGIFTYWRKPDSREAFDALATGLSMALGYLLFMLLGTYLFTTTQQEALFHPDRLGTLVRGLAYPLVFGFFGSIAIQAQQVKSAMETET